MTDPGLLIALRAAISGAVERVDDRDVSARLRSRRADLMAAAGMARWSAHELAAHALFELGTDGESWDLGPLAAKIVDTFLRQVLRDRFPRDVRRRYETELRPLLAVAPDRAEVLAFYASLCA